MIQVAPLLMALGCAPTVYRYPGPLGSLGQATPQLATPLVQPAVVEEQAQPMQDEPLSRRCEREGAQVAKAARSFLGARRLSCCGHVFRYDCSGLVMASYAKAGLELSGDSASMLAQARSDKVFHRRQQPCPGDVAFFENTYDKNGNGRLDDSISHVAVVLSVDGEGTVTMVHYGSKSIKELRMNPDALGESGKESLNDHLRARRKGDRAGTRYLAGELWIGFGSLWLSDGEDR